jgi:cobalt/nickel transport system permease protein
VGHVAGLLVVRAADRAEHVSQAMRCRGFEGRFHSLTSFQTNPADVAFCAVIIAAAAGLLAWDLATFP